MRPVWRCAGRRGSWPCSPSPCAAWARLALDQGDFPTARACHGEALALRREAGSPNLCETLLDVGRLAQEDGDGDGARRLLQEGLDLARANALPHAIATGHDELGRLAWLVGDQRLGQDAPRGGPGGGPRAGGQGADGGRARPPGASRAEPGGRADGGPAPRGGPDPGLGVRRPAPRGQLPGGPGGRRRRPGPGARAARLLGAAAARRDALGAPLPPSRRPWHLRHLERARASLSDEDFGGAWRAGQAMPLERVVAFALVT